MRMLLVLFALIFGLASPLLAAPANTEVKLLLSHAEARPGDTITAALQMVSKPKWHTYWSNPGDAGLPATLTWELPHGITAGEMQFPVPAKLVLAKLYAYVYDGEVLLLLPLTIPANAPAGAVTLNGTVDWLECDDKTCLPQDSPVSATFTTGSESRRSPHADLIDKWRERLPKEAAPFTVSASWEASTNAAQRGLIIEWSPNEEIDKPDFFPFSAETIQVSGETEILEATQTRVRIRKPVELTGETWPAQIAGLILNRTGSEQHLAYTVQLRPAATLNAAGSTTSPAAIQLGGPSATPSILAILGLALLGGLILNVMPCVLPVIALKILGFVNQSRDEPARVRELGIIYMLGVLASFLVLAGVLISVKQATGAANWGFQMQNPYFVVAMTVIVTLVALNLFGVFEITLASGALGGATNLASREGRAGAFYNGVLATLLATPCTAPALGAAVGAVITLPSHIIVLTFLTIGLGLALPYVLLSWNPRWLKFLPKPGAWMEKFKMAMGFPMLATAIWLLSVGAKQFGSGGFLWLGLFLVMLALSAWVWGDFVQRGSRNRGFAMALAALFLIGGYVYALEGKLNWRKPRLAQSGTDDLAVEPGGIPWQRWSPAAVEHARAAGRPVLVDFTADWCLTCQVNKATSLEIASVRRKLKEIDAVALLGDFTVRDPAISAELRRFNRAGVPLVIVFPPDPSAAPILLPELLTPGIVLEALDLAASKKIGSVSAAR